MDFTLRKCGNRCRSRKFNKKGAFRLLTYYAFVAITSYPIESASIASTALDLLGDSGVCISKELEPKKRWIECGWSTNDENVVLEEVLDEDGEKWTFD